MENESNHQWIIVILVGLLIWALFFYKQKYEGQTTEEWFNDYDYCESRLGEYKDALEEANDNIDEANSKIEDAKGYAWENYEEMGNALENLETVDTVSEP